MGTVVLARDRETGERVALKRLEHADGGSILRFKNEFRALGDSSHPNLVKLYDLSCIEGDWLLAMEYVDGTDLLSYLRPAPPVSPFDQGDQSRHGLRIDRLWPAFLQLSRGIRALHRIGVLHRDLKPSNVLVANDRVVLLDFGLVRELDGKETNSSAESVCGTPEYMAPEQACGETLTEASDWYAFGVVLYEALVERLPFPERGFRAIRAKLEREAPALDVAPAISRELRELCMALLDRDPAKRPSGADVARFFGEHAPATPTEPPEPPVEDALATEVMPRSRLSRFVGRSREVGELTSALADARANAMTVVHVRGLSGAGKSALVERFLEIVEAEAISPDAPAPLVLRGRCYERESLPFKALDSVVDALAQHLTGLNAVQVARLLPADFDELARLFPVFDRVETIRAHLAATLARPRSAQEIRLRAEVALQELLARLSAQRPVVIWIDDLQWGDLDSARLLRGWIERMGAIPVLLVLSYRSDETASSACLRFLLESRRDGDPDAARSHVVDVRELDGDDVRALCRGQLDELGSDSDALFDRVVNEAHGSPFLALQLTALARAKLLRGEQDLATLSVAALVEQLGGLLSGEAKRLLAILAVAGRPMPTRQALAVAGIRRGGSHQIHTLRALNLLRTRDPAGEQLLEVYHDRVRESVCGTLTRDDLKRIYDALFAQLEKGLVKDPDWLHALATGAADRERTLLYGRAAAERAITTLAFERAIALFEQCVALTPSSDHGRLGLFCKIAEAAACSGHGRKAADAFLAASRLANAEQAVEFKRLAASHLLRCGRFTEGQALLTEVLGAMGEAVPERNGALVATLLWERLRSRLRGLEFVERAPEDVDPALIARTDLLDDLRAEITPIDPLKSAVFQARHLRCALDAGEPYRIVDALGAQALAVATRGTARSAAEADRLLARAGVLGERHGTPRTLASLYGHRALVAWTLGRAKEVLEPAARANQIILEHLSVENHYYQRLALASARLGALSGLNEFELLRTELAATLAEAHATENRTTLLQLTLVETIVDEINGKPERSPPRLAEQRAELPEGRFSIFHVLHMLATLWASCATGGYELGLACLEQKWPVYRRSAAYHIAFLRQAAHALRSRLLLHQYAMDRTASHVLPIIERDVQALAKLERLGSANWRHRVKARLDVIRGDTEAAVAAYRRSEAAFDKNGAVVDAARDRYAIGLIVGGDEGALLCSDAEALVRSKGAVDPVTLLTSQLPELARAVTVLRRPVPPPSRT
jgi:hypothetical protein